MTATITTLTNHVDACDKRAGESARKLDKVEAKIDESIRERRAELGALAEQVEARHRENRKFFYVLLTGVIIAIATKALDYVHFSAQH